MPLVTLWRSTATGARNRLTTRAVGFAAVLGVVGCIVNGGDRAGEALGDDSSRWSRVPALPDGAADRPTAAGATAHDWIIVPTDRVGPIHRDTRHSDLIRLFGSHDVEDGWVYLAEGFCAPGTLLYSGTPDELQITWKSDSRSEPATVRISGEGARWVTEDGVRIGTTLQELEGKRDDPIQFGGFGWDYGGGASWNGLGLVLQPDADQLELLRDDPRVNEIFGERSVRSDHPLIRQLTVRVVRIELPWEYPNGEVECPEGT